MIRSCSLQYSYSFKLENNGYSVYMNNTFHGHAPYVNGSLNLGRGNTHVHAKKDVELIVIVPLSCDTAA